MSGLLLQVRSADDVIRLVEDVGFLPFFANRIHGFSLEECCPGELWFEDGVDGPWEWKGPAARSGRCLYGKFYGGKAGFVSREWFPDFANFRRDGYDFTTSAYRREPEASRERIIAHLKTVLPEADTEQLSKFFRI